MFVVVVVAIPINQMKNPNETRKRVIHLFFFTYFFFVFFLYISRLKKEAK